ncbi:MAG: hypothetical protein GEV10_19435 [Streptosporangiales bacterium]|nr:hypothetical protein [Streptosporangiales bacterium]
MLPIKAGDRVLVLGVSHRLTKSLDAAGCSVLTAVAPHEHDQTGQVAGEVVVTTGSLPCGDARFDHVLVPLLQAEHVPLVPGELARVLRPDGGLFLGMSYRLRSRARPGTTIRRGRHLLEGNGFTRVSVYGVTRNLETPRYLVPLDSPALMTWFLSTTYLPQTTKGAFASQILGAAAHLRLPPLLFPDLGFVARREA